MKTSWSFRDATSYWITLLIIITGVKSLKNVAVSIPQAVKMFDTATLQCTYNLEEGDVLYTLKWYKGNMEFFRYIPKELPNTRVFPLHGMYLDLSKSNPNEVVLMNVQPENTGRYSCEVSTDAPVFDTQVASSFMYVVDMPNENPIMEISKENLDHGYVIRANCTTPPSFPSMNVTWYLNGVKINESFNKKISLNPAKQSSKNRRTPHMTISFIEKEIDDGIFQGEVVKVQCISTLFNLYRSENVRYIDDNRSQPWPSSVIGFTENLSSRLTMTIWTEILLLVCVCFLLLR